MMARCKLNPCCGETMPGKCNPPPQFLAGESYAEYEARSGVRDDANVDAHPQRYSEACRAVERVIFRRVLQDRVSGFTIATALEILDTLAALAPATEGSETLHPPPDQA